MIIFIKFKNTVLEIIEFYRKHLEKSISYYNNLRGV